MSDDITLKEAGRGGLREKLEQKYKEFLQEIHDSMVKKQAEVVKLTLEEADKYPSDSRERRLIKEIAGQWKFSLNINGIAKIQNLHPMAELLEQGAHGEDGYHIRPKPLQAKAIKDLNFEKYEVIDGDVMQT